MADKVCGRLLLLHFSLILSQLIIRLDSFDPTGSPIQSLLFCLCARGCVCVRPWPPAECRTVEPLVFHSIRLTSVSLAEYLPNCTSYKCTQTHRIILMLPLFFLDSAYFFVSNCGPTYCISCFYCSIFLIYFLSDQL